MKRHIERKHAYQVHSESIVVTNEPLVSEVSLANVVIKVPASMEELLNNLEFEIYKEVFAKEIIDLKMLLRLKASEFMEMVRDIGISAWGHRHKIRKSVEEINKTLEDPVNSLNASKTLDEMLLEEDVLDDNYEDDIVLEENDEKILEKDEERAADIE